MFGNNITGMIKTKYNILRGKIPHLINLNCNADFALEKPTENKELAGTQIRLNSKISLLNVILTFTAAINIIATFILIKKAIFHIRYKRRFH